MVLIEQIARSFGARPRLIRGEETFREAEWQFALSPWQKPQMAVLRDSLVKIPARDTVRVSATLDGGNAILLPASAETDVLEFIEELTTYHDLEGGQNTVEITVQISKCIERNEVSLYSFMHLEGSLSRLNAKQLFAAFEPLCADQTHRCAILQPDVAEFETETIVFCREPRPAIPTNRAKLISVRKDSCHFEGSQRDVLPEDFRFKRPSSSTRFNELCDRLCLCATLAFLSDVSSLADDGTFTFKVNGYRAVTGEFGTQKVSAALVAELFKIHQWAYSEGNTADKLGLARNIISLHWKGDAAVDPDEGIYESILSGYAIYLKEHVDQYISLKKSLCDYLSEFSQKSAKLAESVGEKLEKNLVGFVGFFISTILLKAVTAADLGGLFPKPLQIIAWGLIAASFVHGVLSLWFAIRERKRIIGDFNLLRLRYSDLLHKSDLDRALGEDKGLRETTSHLDFKLRLFFSGWIAILLICSGVVIALSRTMVSDQQKPSSAKGVATTQTTATNLVNSTASVHLQGRLTSTNLSNSNSTNVLALPVTNAP
jgi:hypothetical protein